MYTQKKKKYLHWVQCFLWALREPTQTLKHTSKCCNLLGCDITGNKNNQVKKLNSYPQSRCTEKHGLIYKKTNRSTLTVLSLMNCDSPPFTVNGSVQGSQPHILTPSNQPRGQSHEINTGSEALALSIHPSKEQINVGLQNHRIKKKHT